MTEVWSGRRVFVTGATGLIGSWLVKRLLDGGASVIALIKDMEPGSELIRSGDLDRVIQVHGDLRDAETLDAAIATYRPDTVYHLGAHTIVGTALLDPMETFETNIRGTYNLLEACRTHPGVVERILVASSDKAYGTQAVLPYTEEAPLIGQAPYDVSKSCVDLIAQSYHSTYGLPVVIARCGNTYGGGDLNWTRLVPGTIRSVLAGEAPVIRSDGTFVRDYIFVKDVAQAYLTLGEQPIEQVAGEAFNFSDESPRTVLEMAQAVLRAMGMADVEPVIENSAQAEIKSQYLSAAKARERLGWTPQFALDEGLAETVEWYRAFLGAAR